MMGMRDRQEGDMGEFGQPGWIEDGAWARIQGMDEAARQSAGVIRDAHDTGSGQQAGTDTGARQGGSQGSDGRRTGQRTR